MAETCAIEGDQLTRQFGGFRALKGVDLAVPRGEIRGLIGPNGAGKSTLIDVLSGRAPRWSGTVKMFGDDISAMTAQQRRRAGLARSFQRTNIFLDLTVIDQLELAGRAAEMPNIDEIMAELNLAARWGVTVLLVEHDMEVVFSICDRITVLHLGAILAEGTPEEIRGVPEVVTAYLGGSL
jgi:branched-chain amino acid transport system ATP-binding protein